MSYAAIVLAGGAARRMGGAAKPLVPVGGVPMLSRVLEAVRDAPTVVVVGPPSLQDCIGESAGVLLTREEPPGGGPVAAIAAGLAHCPDATVVAVVAADLPFVTERALGRLRAAVAEGADVAVYLDGTGRRQSLCAVWGAGALRAALPEPAAGRAVRELFESAGPVAELRWHEDGPPPWLDCDTPEQVSGAETMTHDHA